MLSITNEISYDSWRKLEYFDRALLIGELGEQLWIDELKKLVYTRGVKKQNYQSFGYDISHFNTALRQIIKTEVKTQRPNYGGGGWTCYYIETSNASKTKPPEFLTHDVDEYIVFDMHEVAFYCYNCKVLRKNINFIVHDEYDGSLGEYFEFKNTQGSAYGINSIPKTSKILGFKEKLPCIIPDKYKWLASHIKRDVEAGLV